MTSSAACRTVRAAGAPALDLKDFVEAIMDILQCDDVPLASRDHVIDDGGAHPFGAHGQFGVLLIESFPFCERGCLHPPSPSPSRKILGAGGGDVPTHDPHPPPARFSLSTSRKLGHAAPANRKSR